MPPRGALIVFEGLDHCGKSLQTSLLASSLPSSAVLQFPDRTTPSGALINSYLGCAQHNISDQAIHLLFSANRWEASPKLKAMLAAGTTVIVDRYAYSGTAYTTAKGVVGMDWCKAPDRGLLVPDLVVFLDVPPVIAAGRAGYGQERYENLEFQDKVAAQFAQLRDGDKCWAVVDGTRSVEEVYADVLALATNAVERAKEAPLQEGLWC